LRSEIVIDKSAFFNISVISVDLGHNCGACCAILIADAGVGFSIPRIAVLSGREYPSENNLYL
jgi:hypothetical protein